MNEKFGSLHMFTLFATVWDLLPIAAVLDDAIFVCHGGLFRVGNITINHLNALPRRDCDLRSDRCKGI